MNVFCLQNIIRRWVFVLGFFLQNLQQDVPFKQLPIIIINESLWKNFGYRILTFYPAWVCCKRLGQTICQTSQYSLNRQAYSLTFVL